MRIHALLDGRDTAPSSALGFVADLERRLAATIPMRGSRRSAGGTGRWTANAGATERGYDAIVHGEGRHAPSAVAAIEEAAARGETDEFVDPTIIDGVDGRPRRRPRRPRQLPRRPRAAADPALRLPDFDAFDRTSPSGRPAPAACSS